MALSVARATQIVDRISEIDASAGFLHPVSLAEVGASSTAEALAAFYLVIAKTFRAATLDDGPENRELLQEFIQFAHELTGCIATGRVQFYLGYGQSKKLGALSNRQSIDSFVAFLSSLNAASSDYWVRVYSRIVWTMADFSEELFPRKRARVPKWLIIAGVYYILGCVFMRFGIPGAVDNLLIDHSWELEPEPELFASIFDAIVVLISPFLAAWFIAFAAMFVLAPLFLVGERVVQSLRRFFRKGP